MERGRGDVRGGLQTIDRALICPCNPFKEDFVDAREKAKVPQLDQEKFFYWKSYFSNQKFQRVIIAGHY